MINQGAKRKCSKQIVRAFSRSREQSNFQIELFSNFQIELVTCVLLQVGI